MLEDVLQGQALSDEDAAELREVAAAMVERHVEMFPALHAERSSIRASTELKEPYPPEKVVSTPVSRDGCPRDRRAAPP
jgi:hypothetical protein